MHEGVAPMPTAETLLRSTQSSAIFKDTESGAKKISILLTAEIMVSGRVR